MQYSDIKLQRDSSMPLFLQLADALKILIAQTEPGHQEKLLSEETCRIAANKPHDRPQSIR